MVIWSKNGLYVGTDPSQFLESVEMLDICGVRFREKREIPSYSMFSLFLRILLSNFSNNFVQKDN